MDIKSVVKKLSDDMQREMTAAYFKAIADFEIRMLKRQVHDPMRPVVGAKYARFVEYGRATSAQEWGK